MVGQKGEKHWSKVKYLAIENEKSFKANDCFTNEEGLQNTDLPQHLWENQFSIKEGHTLVTCTLTFDTLKDLEKIIEMGFEGGFTMGLNQLDKLLASLKDE